MGSKSQTAQLEHIRQKFVEWCRYPDTDSRRAAGLPATRIEFAKQYGVNRTTLYRWETSKDFKRDIVDGVLNIYTREDITDVLLKLREEAKKGKSWHMGKFLELTGVSGKFAVEPEVVETNEFEGWTESEIEDFLATTIDGEPEA